VVFGERAEATLPRGLGDANRGQQSPRPGRKRWAVVFIEIEQIEQKRRKEEKSDSAHNQISMLKTMATTPPSLPLSPPDKPPLRQMPTPAAFLSSVRDRCRWAYSFAGGSSGTAATATTTTDASSSPSSAPANLDSTAPPQQQQRRPATHLCVLVHGLWGRPSDWDVVAERLSEHKQRIEGDGGGGEGQGKGKGKGRESLCVLKSEANRRRLTLDGIDVCASRLAEEVRAAVAEERERFGKEARLERVSFVGHSMGGLIARAAVAELLDDKGDGGDGSAKNPNQESSKNPTKKKTKPTTLAGGLRPAHFVSIATPHLGCHAEAEATTAFVAATKAAAAEAAAAGEKEKEKLKQHPALIPLVSWIAGASSVSATVAPRLLAAAAARASASMGRSGPQFFLTDGGGGEGEKEGGKEGGKTSKVSRQQQPPLLARLADPSLPALRALAAFESRTTFANSSGDHLVGWSNASLRSPSELPREQLRAATAARAAAKEAKEASSGGGGGEVETETETETTTTTTTTTAADSWTSRLLKRRGAAAAVKEGGVGVVLDDGVAAAFEHKKGGSSGGKGDRKEGGKEKEGEQGEKELDLIDRMLSSLSSLPWRRVDACFQGSPTPFLAHNHIQATHFFNERVGRASADAIARALVEADEELLRRRKEGKK